jgi:hypothetical protein
VEQRRVLATNSEWTVTAVGDVNSPGQGFGRNVVRFQVARRGENYASGPLYEAGPHDRPFTALYPRADWLETNVLRLSTPASTAERRASLGITNDASEVVKWLQVTLNELVLIVDIVPGKQLEVSTVYWGPATLRVLGEFDNGRSIKKAIPVADYIRHISVGINTSSVTLNVTK